MKKTIKTFLVLSITVLAISCGQHSEDKQEHEKMEDHDTHQHDAETKEKAETEKHNTEGGLQLDNGKAWLANMETTVGINNMIKLINAFSEKESIDSYSELKNNLKAEFNMIIKECSMTGEPHNQLHNYLLPMGEMFEGIGSAELNTCKTNFDKLNTRLAEYSTYFK